MVEIWGSPESSPFWLKDAEGIFDVESLKLISGGSRAFSVLVKLSDSWGLATLRGLLALYLPLLTNSY